MESNRQTARIPLGSGSMDNLLAGGLEPAILSAVVGEAGAGKTTFAILLALSRLQAGPVIYLDSEGGLSPERIRQISPKADLKKILLKRVFDFREQEKAVLALEKQNCSAVIVDSIVSNYRLLLSDRTAEAVNARLAAQMSFLNNLAGKKGIPVLVTGHTYRKKDGILKIVGGQAFSYAPKTIVILEKAGEGKRVARIAKSRTIAEGSSVDFSIIDSGFS